MRKCCEFLDFTVFSPLRYNNFQLNKMPTEMLQRYSVHMIQPLIPFHLRYYTMNWTSFANDVDATNSVPWRLDRLSVAVCRNCIADLVGISILPNIIFSMVAAAVAVPVACSFSQQTDACWSVCAMHEPTKHINMSKHQDEHINEHKTKKERTKKNPWKSNTFRWYSSDSMCFN